MKNPLMMNPPVIKYTGPLKSVQQKLDSIRSELNSNVDCESSIPTFKDHVQNLIRTSSSAMDQFSSEKVYEIDSNVTRSKRASVDMRTNYASKLLK
jgi:hypothetical protein